jgi:hypothetical protein
MIHSCFSPFSLTVRFTSSHNINPKVSPLALVIKKFVLLSYATHACVLEVHSISESTVDTDSINIRHKANREVLAYSLEMFKLGITKNRCTYMIYLEKGLPADALGVYLPGKFRADNCFAYPSTAAAAMDLVNFVSIAGAN